MANKPLQFVLVERKLNVGANAGKVVQIAQPTGRHRVSFRNFCERVAKSTTFNRQEVEAVLNYATEIARDIVAKWRHRRVWRFRYAQTLIQEQIRPTRRGF